MASRRILALVTALAAGLTLAACRTTGGDGADGTGDGAAQTGTTFQRDGVMRTAFDPEAAAYVQAAGVASVRGRIFTTLNGETIPGKLAVVKLIPDTPYSREHLWHIFGDLRMATAGVDFANLDPRYQQHMRIVRADENGQFEFFGVPDGIYFIYAVRTADGINYANLEPVTVTNQQHVTIDVDGV